VKEEHPEIVGGDNEVIKKFA